MDNNTLLFQDKGSGRFKDVKIYLIALRYSRRALSAASTPRLSTLRTSRGSAESRAATFFCATGC